MSNFILIPVLFFVFCWLLYWANKRQTVRFSWNEIALILGIRVVLGFLYGYIFAKYFNGDDTWYFHQGSIEEQQKLISNPLQFFADFNPLPAFERNPTFASGWYYYLSDLEFWVITKPMALFNLITRGDYYANVVCFNFLVCWGSIWLFRFLLKTYETKRKLVFFCVFILPVPLFWMTGIRAEGWLLFFLAGGLISFEKILSGLSLKNIVWLVISLTGIMILRSVLLLLLIPVLIAWWLQVRQRWPAVRTIFLVFGVGLVLFFGSTLIDDQNNLPTIVVKRQQAFFSLHGQTRIALDSLSPTVGSFIRVFPQAAGNSFIRPFVWEARGILQIFASFSTLFLVVLLILWFLKRDRLSQPWLLNSRLLYPFIFGVLLYLFIGYTIPFPGAIIRYKSIGEWFLICPLILEIRWSSIYRL